MYIYYVYAYLREKDNTPYYIGKGKGNRAYQKSHCVKVPKDKFKIIFYQIGLVEENAFKLECAYIKLFGRKDLSTGILRNVTDGGDGARNPSIETREKLSKAQIGKKASIETKMKMSNSRLGIKNHNYGKPMTDETKQKLSKSKLGKRNSDESNEKRRKWNIENNWKPPIRYNQNPSAEVRSKLSATHKGKPKSEEQRRKQSETMKKLHSLRLQKM
jgi:hypothetical protein